MRTGRVIILTKYNIGQQEDGEKKAKKGKAHDTALPPLMDTGLAAAVMVMKDAAKVTWRNKATWLNGARGEIGLIQEARSDEMLVEEARLLRLAGLHVGPGLGLGMSSIAGELHVDGLQDEVMNDCWKICPGQQF